MNRRAILGGNMYGGKVPEGITMTPRPQPENIHSSLRGGSSNQLPLIRNVADATGANTTPTNDDGDDKEPKKIAKWLLVLIIVGAIVSIIGMCVGGYFVYTKIIKKKKDESPASSTQAQAPAQAQAQDQYTPPNGRGDESAGVTIDEEQPYYKSM